MPQEPDLHISDLAVTLEPGPPEAPLQPLVHRLGLQLSDVGFAKVIGALVAIADQRAPVDITLASCRLVPDGAELSARAGKGILRATLTTTIATSVVGGKEIRCELTDLQVPAWVPVDRLLERAIGSAGIEGLRLDPDNPRAILVDPAVILASQGLPAHLAPGAWSLDITSAVLNLGFAEELGTEDEGLRTEE